MNHMIFFILNVVRMNTSKIKQTWLGELIVRLENQNEF